MGEQIGPVQMQSAEELREKLSAVDVFGTTPQTDRFYNAFIDMIAGTSITADGLIAAWELAYTQVAPTTKFDGMMRTLHEMNFGFVMDLISTDPAVAQRAKELRQENKTRRSQE